MPVITAGTLFVWKRRRVLKKTFSGAKLATIIAGLIMMTGVAANSQAQQGFPTETIKMTYGALDVTTNAKSVEIVVGTPDREKFMEDPVDALQRQGVAVPQPAETHLRTLALALRQLANPQQAKPARRTTSGKAMVYFKVILTNAPGMELSIVGNRSGDGTTAGPRLVDPNTFLTNPVHALRMWGVPVPAADERAWRQFANATKGLRSVLSPIRFKRNAEAKSAPGEFDKRTETKSTQAVTPRGWDPKKKVPVAGPTASQAQGGDPERPVVLGRLYNGIEKVVGTCNTRGGCEKLKAACKSTKNHSYKTAAADGSLGTCMDEAYNPATSTFYLRNSNTPGAPGKPAADVDLAAPKKSSEATLYCHGAVMCRKVKNICAALGGTYTPIYDLSGSCQSAQQRANVSSDSFYGTGIYKSTDTGRTWTVVGTCNTTRGCLALKDACGSLKGHTLKSSDAAGSLGTCSAQPGFFLKNTNSAGSGNPQPPTRPTPDLGLAAPKKTSEATLYCHGAVFCRKVKNICAALGGKYRTIYDLSGACNY